MKLENPVETPQAKILHRATDRSLRKFNLARQPAWDKLQKALRAAWRQYEKDIAPLELHCDHEIALASRTYSKATQHNTEAK